MHSLVNLPTSVRFENYKYELSTFIMFVMQIKWGQEYNDGYYYLNSATI
jgi:hypothetical protein